MKEGAFRKHLIDRNIVHRTHKDGFIIIEATETKPKIFVYPDLLRWTKIGVIAKREKEKGMSKDVNSFFEMYANTELMK